MNEQAHLLSLGWTRLPSGLWTHPKLGGTFNTQDALWAVVR